MKKLIIKFAALFLILASISTINSGLLSKKAYAENLSLTVNPPIYQLQIIPPVDQREKITLSNNDSESVAVQVIYKIFISNNKNGQVKYLTENDVFPGKDKQILQKVQIIDGNVAKNAFILGPWEKKDLQVRVNLPNNEPSSDYYFSIIFIARTISQPQGNITIQNNDTYSNIQAGVGINILLSVGEKMQPQLYINDFSSPWFLQSGPVEFTLNVANQQKQVSSTYGLININNMFGQEVGQVIIPKTIILANSNRYLIDLKQSINDQNKQYQYPLAVWPETFLLGPYTATLNLKVYDKGPLYVRTIHFFAFPIQYIAALLIFGIIVLLIYLRVKHYREI